MYALQRRTGPVLSQILRHRILPEVSNWQVSIRQLLLQVEQALIGAVESKESLHLWVPPSNEYETGDGVRQIVCYAATNTEYGPVRTLMHLDGHIQLPRDSRGKSF